MATRQPLQPAKVLGDRTLADLLREGGVAGAGGAGFPTYAKYLKPHPYHMTNAQESEPGYYIDKWLHREYAQEFADLYQFLLDWGCRKILIGPKFKDREWFRPLEEITGGRVIDCRGKNAIHPDDFEEPFLFVYTDDNYAFGKEQALLRVTCNVKLKAKELPTDHGYIVNNSETLFNMYRVLTEGRPVTTKFVHIYGETPQHVFLEAPLGTLAEDLFQEAGMSLKEIQEKGFVVLDGGPGWYSVVEDPANCVLTKRINSLLVIDPAYADPKRNDVRTVGNRQGYPREPREQQEDSPRECLRPRRVRVALTDNPEMPIITPAIPVVEVGQTVQVGDVIAKAADEGFSIPQHASLDGKVTQVTEDWIEISAE